MVVRRGSVVRPASCRRAGLPGSRITPRLGHAIASATAASTRATSSAGRRTVILIPAIPNHTIPATLGHSTIPDPACRGGLPTMQCHWWRGDLARVCCRSAYWWEPSDSRCLWWQCCSCVDCRATLATRIVEARSLADALATLYRWMPIGRGLTTGGRRLRIGVVGRRFRGRSRSRRSRLWCFV